ncbi:MobC family plasmid mobilization relaxosome protein, partial [Klebsiella pneumoniae]
MQRPPLPGINAPGDLVQVVAHSGQLPQERRIYGRRRRSALLRQLAGMGNNLNQIARRVNSGEW